MHASRALVLVALVAASMIALPTAAGGAVAADATVAPSDTAAADGFEDERAAGYGDPVRAQDDDPAHARGPIRAQDENSSTEDTIGYVEGYWHDDPLPVDDRDDATLSEAELEEVVYRSMARVEVIRERTFRSAVPVDVVTREEYREEHVETDDVTEAERLSENVRLEALFLADRDTDAIDAKTDLRGDSVGGFYEPETDRIVLVSENVEEPELDEVTLAHELTHALQDQRVDLSNYEWETQNGEHAALGLIEGEAGWVDGTYEERCGTEWSCTTPETEQSPPSSGFNWGMYFVLFHPYDDGPDYVEHLYEEGDWEAVDAAFDEPPASASEVIRPGEQREARGIEVEDQSSDAWRRHEVDGEVANDTIGEAAMVSMLVDGAIEGGESVIGVDEFVDTGPLGTIEGFDYDQPYTDGWAGDELVVYVGDEATVEESGYVWRTEWTSDADAEAFRDGYRSLIELNGAEAVGDREDRYVIDSGYPGAYAVERDGDTVTVVRAPSVEELPEIADVEVDSDAGTDDEEGAADDGDGGLLTDVVPGFGVGAALAGLVLLAIAVRARR